MLKCPYDNCEFKTETWWGLKIHVQRRHKLNGTCPICNQKFNNLLRHFIEQSRRCEKHAIFYAVYGKRSSTTPKHTTTLRTCTSLAIATLEVEE